MNLPSSIPTSTSDSTEICQDKDCKNPNSSLVIHSVRLRTLLQFFCTHCLLKNHPTSFCPTCFVFYDNSPPHASRRITCSNSHCQSWTHTQCASDQTPYLCPPCRNPDTFSFFTPIVGPNGERFVDKALSEVFYCAAKIAASSMSKAVTTARGDAERRCKDAALAKKRAREALEDVVSLDSKEKARSVIPKLKEACIEVSREVKPKVIAVNGGVKESNGGGVEKQSANVTMAKVKQEG